MKTQTKELHYISNNHNTLTINCHTEALPILWNNRGLFCIISRQKVQNMLDLLRDVEKLPVLNARSDAVFHWDDHTLIDAKIASKLLS